MLLVGVGALACSAEPSPTPVVTPTLGPTPSAATATPSAPTPTVPVATPSATASAAPTPSQTPSAPPTATGTPVPTPDAAARLCEDAPVVTWENFGQGFTIENCQSCHASTAPNRYGAPPYVVFDTHNDVKTWRERMLDRATGDAPTMPPGGGVSEEDRALLEIWLTCYEP